MDFTGKRILITGGARGIGRATALAFAEHGALVAINYRSSEQEAEATLAMLSGGPHVSIQGDINQEEDIRRMVDQVVERWGALDILVNNAGIYTQHPIVESSFETWRNNWDTTLQTNLLAAAHVTYFAVQQMLKQGGGRIVNISSRGAFRGEPDTPAYAASKAGLNAMSQSLAQSLAPHNIFVGVVAPGFVETDMAAAILEGPEGDAIRAQSPLGRVARPEEVAWAVLFLASEKASFSTGTIIDVNGASYLR